MLSLRIGFCCGLFLLTILFHVRLGATRPSGLRTTRQGEPAALEEPEEIVVSNSPSPRRRPTLVHRETGDTLDQTSSEWLSVAQKILADLGGFVDQEVSSANEVEPLNLVTEGLEQPATTNATMTPERSILVKRNAHDNTCDEGTLPCGDHSCYPITKRCDGLVHCRDASDEVGCTCSDRMASADKLCDSYPDCPDFSDELGCGGCAPGEFNCTLNGITSCVAADAICDSGCSGISDILCARLALKEENTSIIRTKGYFEVKRGGQWHPVCGTYQTNFALVVKDYCDAVMGSRYTPDNLRFLAPEGDAPNSWAHYDVDTKTYSVSSECEDNLLLYIMCAKPKCGQPESNRKRRGTEDQDDVTKLDSLHPLPTPRIIGGYPAKPYQWSFAVGILSNGDFHCGGTILTAEWILTAAHCFFDRYLDRQMEVEAGMYRRFSWSPFKQTSNVTHVLRHPEFGHHLQYDAALLKLETPLQFNRWVRPVCLAQSHLPQEEELCTVAGWGTQDEDMISAKPDVMMEVEIPVWKTCTEAFKGFSDDFLICAGYNKGQRDACFGDSGGPLMCHGEEGWVQSGIISFGRGCAHPNEPGAYSRVTYFLPWINGMLERLKTSNSSLISLTTSCSGFLCQLPTGKCLHTKFECDGKVNCLDARDEFGCYPEVVEAAEAADIDTAANEAHSDGTDDTDAPYTTPGSIIISDTEHEGGINLPIRDIIDTGTNESVYGGYDNSFSTSASAVPPVPLVCAADQFMCGVVPKCVQFTEVCDGILNCPDGTDELYCSCGERVMHYNSSWECDGYFDCFDLSDEFCPPPEMCDGMFVCPLSRECVPREQVCDAMINCRYGEDEMGCLALLREPGKLLLDKFGEPVHSSHGTVAYFGQNGWGPVCTESISPDMLNEICVYLGYRNVRFSKKIFGPRDLIRTDETGVYAKALKERSGSEDYVWQNTEAGTRVSRSVTEKTSNIISTEKIKFLAGLREIMERSLKREKREDTCPQVDLYCSTEPCGKIPRYALTVELPLHELGGVPWAATVFINGDMWCGATLIHPFWVLTSKACMAYGGAEVPNLLVDFVTVVMGSFREVGDTPRLWGGHEHDRRVDFMKDVANSDILVLHLLERMPKSLYINHLCLPTRIVDHMTVNRTCVMAGYSERDSRTTLGVKFTGGVNCGAREVCVSNSTEDTPCMRSWSGVIACQFGWISDPTWAAVGMWTYQPLDTNCTEVPSHKLFTDEELLGINRIRDHFIPPTLATCDGHECPTGICVDSSEQCDGHRSCPDLSDEPSTCKPLLSVCRFNETGICVCDDGGMPCSDGICIPNDQVCDGKKDCTDGADENNCTCARMLWRDDSDQLCDGTIDCQDEGDEAVCGCTPKAEFFRCYKSNPQKCIPRTDLCNGVKDCANGEDESDCVALTPTIPIEENQLGVLPLQMEGYFLVRLRGVWYTLPYDTYDLHVSPLLCFKMGLRYERTEKRDYEDLLQGVVYVKCKEKLEYPDAK